MYSRTGVYGGAVRVPGSVDVLQFMTRRIRYRRAPVEFRIIYPGVGTLTLLRALATHSHILGLKE